MRLYLDHNATTPVRPEVIEAVADAMRAAGNPSSVHAEGQAARAAVERARVQLGKAICARPQDIVFTSGGTEANNLALHCAIEAGGAKRVLISAVEHEAVVEYVKAEAKHGAVEVETIPVDGHGVVDLAWLEERLSKWDEADGRPAVALMLANNEIGVIQPVAEAARLAHEAGGLLIVDAIQAFGKIPVDFAGLGADYMTVSGHKIGGPQGIGAMILACDSPVSRHHHGGGQESGRRSGTENVPGIVGLGVAAQASAEQLERFSGLKAQRDSIIAGLKAASPDSVVLGEGADRLPNTISFATPGWPGPVQLMALDLEGVSVSGGSACSSGTVKGGKVPTALGLPAEIGGSAIRISLGWNSQPEDAEAFVKAWTRAHARAGLVNQNA